MKLLRGSKFQNNVSWVLIGNAIHAVFQFAVNILAARVLLTADYGLINYAGSVVSLMVAIAALGFGGIITKKFAEKEELAGKYLWTATISTLLISIPLVLICLIVSVIHAPNDTTLHAVMLCQALTIPFSAHVFFIYWFRYKYKASLVAIFRFVAFGVAAIWRLIALFVFRSVTLYVLGTSCETIILGIILLYIYKQNDFPKLSFDKSCLKEMIRISYPFIFSAILTTIYGQTDKIMLESMLDRESVAYYSVALTLAGAVSIIPSAIIEGFRPEIMRLKEANETSYQRRMRQSYCSVFWICICYCLFITVFAKEIILILYGEAYLPAVNALALVVWYTSFSYFGSINNIFMVAEQKSKWVQITTLLGAIVNIVLNAVLIPCWGVVGAAAASLITQILLNNILLLLIPPLRKCFYLQLKGICNIDCFTFRKNKNNMNKG